MTDPIQIESPTAQINRARYAGKDFFTFIDDIVARIQVLFVTEFNDFVVSGTGQMLIDIVSWACETLSFYIDRQASESYLQTARLRKSVNRLTRQNGYKMAGAVAASVDLDVTLAAIQGFDVPIHIGYPFKGPNGLIFVAVEAVTFPAGEGPLSTPRQVGVREGVNKTEVFTSNGQRNQVFRLNPGEGKWVAEGTVVVRVAGVAWEIVELITFDQTNQVEIDFNSEPATVRFGDGVAGNVPPTSAEIRVESIATSGKSGLVMADSITEGNEPLVVMFQEIGLVITNPDPSSGGADAEDLTSAKAKAPRFFKARNVAVTQEDYVGLSQAYADPIAGAVAVAQAFVARGAEEDLMLQGLLDNIRAITLPLKTDVMGQTASARALATAAEAKRTATDTALTTVGAKYDVITTLPLTPGATGAAIDIRDEAETVRGDVIDSTVLADEGLATAGDAGKNARFVAIKVELASMGARLNTIISKTNDIQTAVSDGKTQLGVAFTNLSGQEADIAAIIVDLADIDALVSTSFETSIETQLDAIYEHVDGFLAADCKSNLVQVPILTRDVNGFLTEPPIALLRSLERYLDARKEVTQVVEVVSGGPFLVYADIDVTIGIRDGFVHATVLSNVRKAIDDLLRVRAFGKSLRLSDLYAVVVPNPSTGQKGVDGVSYAVFEIVGPALLVDSSGNLIIPAKQVITKGTVTAVGEVAAP